MSRLVVALVAAMLLIPLSAEAAVSGARSDPLGDGVDLDASRVGVTYDREAGRLAVQVNLDPGNATFGGRFRLSVGSALSDGRCSAGADGDLRIDSTLNWDMTYGTAEMLGQGPVATVSGPDSGVSESFPVYVYTFQAEQLKGRNYRCVTAISLEGSGPADEVAEFCLGPCQAAPEPISIRWRTPRDGQTVSGFLHEGRDSCWLEASGPVVRTENWVDGVHNDDQSQYPWGCEIDTRRYANGRHKLTVKAFAADGSMVEHSIRVKFQNASVAVSPPASPFQEQVQPLTPAAPAGGDGSGASDGPILRMRSARKHVRTVLRRTFGRELTRGRRYRTRCARLDSATVRCGVRWVSRRYRYKGSVRIYVTDRWHYESHVRRVPR